MHQHRSESVRKRRRSNAHSFKKSCKILQIEGIKVYIDLYQKTRRPASTLLLRWFFKYQHRHSSGAAILPVKPSVVVVLPIYNIFPPFCTLLYCRRSMSLANAHGAFTQRILYSFLRYQTRQLALIHPILGRLQVDFYHGHSIEQTRMHTIISCLVVDLECGSPYPVGLPLGGSPCASIFTMASSSILFCCRTN